MINLVSSALDTSFIIHAFVVTLVLAVTWFVFWFGFKSPEEPPFKQFSHLSTLKSNTKSKKKEKKLHLNDDITNSDSTKGKDKIVKHQNKTSQTESKAVKHASIPSKLTDISKQISSGKKKEKKDIGEKLKTTKSHDNNEDDGWESVSRKDKKSRKIGNEESSKARGAVKNQKNKSDKVNKKNADETKNMTENEKIKSAKRTNDIKEEKPKKSNDGPSVKLAEEKEVKAVKREAETTNHSGDENNNRKNTKNGKSENLESSVIAKKTPVANSAVKASDEKVKSENNSPAKAPSAKEKKTENSSSGKQSDAKKKSIKNVDQTSEKEKNIANKENMDKNRTTVKSYKNETIIKTMTITNSKTIIKTKMDDKNVQKLKEPNNKQQSKPPANKENNIVDTPIVKKETTVQKPNVNAKKKKPMK